MRTQTFAAFLLTAALPAIVAALPTNIPNTQLTSAPAFEARSTHDIEDISLAKRSEVVARQEGGQPEYDIYESDMDGLEGPEQASHQFGGEEPEDFEDLMNGQVDFSKFQEQMLQRQDEELRDEERRQKDSNWEGPLEDGEPFGMKSVPEEPFDFDFNILEARSDEAPSPDMGLVVDEQVPTRFRRRHEGHGDGHETNDEGAEPEQAHSGNVDGHETDVEGAEPEEAHAGHGDEPHDDEDTVEEEDEMVERRQLGHMAEDEGDDDEDDAFAGLDMSAHAGDDEDGDDDEEEALVDEDYEDAEYEEDGFGLDRRDLPGVNNGAADSSIIIEKREVGTEQTTTPPPPIAIERRVARSFRA